MSVSRRQFLRATAVAGASLALPVRKARSSVGPNEQIRVAVVGVGGRGKDHIDGFGKDIVALCDADQYFLDLRAKEIEDKYGTKVEKFRDFRQLLDNKNIDAISIATPNHTHSLIGISAIQAGKDVYTEKPISHNVWEGRQLVNAARKYNRVVQCGTQLRSSPSVISAVDYVHQGKLGKVRYVIGTCYKPRKSIGKSSVPLSFPKSVDRNLWLGPAADVAIYRPEKNSKGGYLPHYDWHWDFNTGCGDVGNQGIHEMDLCRWFLNEDTLPPRVMSIGGRVGYDDAGNTPNTQIIFYGYEQAPLIFEVRGLPKSKAAQEKWGDSMDEFRGSQIGLIVQCEQGSILINDYEQARALDNEGKTLEHWIGAGDHFQNFLQAVRSHDSAILNADILQGHLSSALCHLGNISHRLGSKQSAAAIEKVISNDELQADSFRRMSDHLKANEVDISGEVLTVGPWLELNAEAERFIGNEQANELLARKGRQPFAVPDMST
ncbi:MAG: Gfo/Idh/MocA family oxidoreductase [Pirellulales bacterium]